MTNSDKKEEGAGFHMLSDHLKEEEIPHLDVLKKLLDLPNEMIDRIITFVDTYELSSNFIFVNKTIYKICRSVLDGAIVLEDDSKVNEDLKRVSMAKEVVSSIKYLILQNIDSNALMFEEIEHIHQ